MKHLPPRLKKYMKKFLRNIYIFFVWFVIIKVMTWSTFFIIIIIKVSLD